MLGYTYMSLIYIGYGKVPTHSFKSLQPQGVFKILNHTQGSTFIYKKAYIYKYLYKCRPYDYIIQC